MIPLLRRATSGMQAWGWGWRVGGSCLVHGQESAAPPVLPQAWSAVLPWAWSILRMPERLFPEIWPSGPFYCLKTGEAPRGSQWPRPSVFVVWVRSTTMVSIQPCPALGDSGAGSLHALRSCTAHLWFEGAASAGLVLGLIRVAAFFHLGAHGHRAPLGPSLPEGGGGALPPTQPQAPFPLVSLAQSWRSST